MLQRFIPSFREFVVSLHIKELKCPHCNNVFQVDQAAFESIAGQVRNKVFEDEVARRTSEVREKIKDEYELRRLKDAQEYKDSLTENRRSLDERNNEIQLLREKLHSLKDNQESKLREAEARQARNLAEELASKDAEINDLKGKLRLHEGEKKIALMNERQLSSDLIREKDAVIAELQNRIEAAGKEAELNLAALREQHAIVLSEKEREIQYHKEFKIRMSTKMIGETLEIHCRTMFSQAQSMGLFPSASFEKDNDIRTGTKGDFIFRDYDEGVEYISIMFEMKNEADTTAARHKNEDFLEKLDKDRRDKNCEYAVLVSMLERDSELYNDGIVNMSHRFPKMYVIRPQMFMTLIALLCQASRKSMHEIRALRMELEVARAQSIDITNFERRRDQFVASFGKLVEAHVKKHEDAMSGIDKVIEALEKQAEALRKVKSLFETSEKKLLKAGESVENDFTIKKLTHGNPTMREKFKAIRDSENLVGASELPADDH